MLSGGGKCITSYCLCFILPPPLRWQLWVHNPFRIGTSSSPGFNGIVAEERSLPACEGELCGVSSLSAQLELN